MDIIKDTILIGGFLLVGTGSIILIKKKESYILAVFSHLNKYIVCLFSFLIALFLWILIINMNQN